MCNSAMLKPTNSNQLTSGADLDLLDDLQSEQKIKQAAIISRRPFVANRNCSVNYCVVFILFVYFFSLRVKRYEI